MILITLRRFEVHALSLLVPTAWLADEILNDAQLVSIDHTGVGYFLTLSHPSFPAERTTHSEPFVIGDAGALCVGFIAYTGDGELTLECHGMGTDVPSDARDQPFLISIATPQVVRGSL
jgi:hypothetical protein